MGLFGRLLGRGEVAADSRLTAFYNGSLAEWQSIYNGGGSWRYTRKGGIKGGSRRVASLNAAKTVCEELSRLCYAEGSELICSDSEGARLLERVLRENRFTERFPQFLERVFALGGGAVRVYWDEGIKLDFVTADCFVPTDWESGRITGAAFASRITRGSESYILTQSQRIEGGDCIVENRLAKESGAKAELKSLYPDLPERYRIEGLGEPLFVYFRAGSGVLECCPALGASVYSGAEDTLKSIDTVFDSLEREFILGKKRIIVPYYAVRGEYDGGELKHYFDVNDEVFQAMSTSDTEELNIVDSSAELRVTEHLDALSGLLDLLCAQVGLSEGALSYKDGTLRTATEVVSRNSRTYRTQCFYRRRISDGLQRMADCIFTLAKMAGLLSDSGNYTASVTYADGAAEDDGTRIERAVTLYNAGLISKARALAKIYGISVEEAQRMERSEQDEKHSDE